MKGILSRFGVWIGAFFGGIFSKTVDWATEFFTRRFARVVVGVGLILGGTTALMLTLKALIVGISVVVPDIAVQAAGHVIPSNALLCLSSIITAKVARYTYDFATKMTMVKYLGG